MKHVYNLKVYREETNELSIAWSDMYFTSLEAACRYGERIHRKFGHMYRVEKINLITNIKYLW